MGIKRIVNKGEIFQSNNYGEFEIVSEIKSNKKKRKFIIRFLQTGTKKECYINEILKGEVKDNFLPKIHGIGYLGNGHKKGNEKLYNIWISMIGRCYNKNDKAYKYYGEKGITIDRRWHCFEYFLEDVIKLKNYNENLTKKSLIELDKDLLQLNVETSKKVYSKETCIWIPKRTNNNIQIVETNIDKNTSSKYVGVCYLPKSGHYQTSININKKQTYIGTFLTEIAAANAYNYYAQKHNNELIQNNCPFMGKSEWLQYQTTK